MTAWISCVYSDCNLFPFVPDLKRQHVSFIYSPFHYGRGILHFPYRCSEVVKYSSWQCEVFTGHHVDFSILAANIRSSTTNPFIAGIRFMRRPDNGLLIYSA